MGVAGAENEPEIPDRRMVGGRPHQEGSQTGAPYDGVDEDVAEPGEGGVVGDETTDPDLVVAGPYRPRVSDSATDRATTS